MNPPPPSAGCPAAQPRKPNGGARPLLLSAASSSLRRSLRSLSRERKAGAAGARCEDHDDEEQGASTSEEPERAPGSARRPSPKGNPSRGARAPAPPPRQHPEKQPTDPKLPPSSPPVAAKRKVRGRSRSRVRALLLRRGSHDGTAESNSESAAVLPNAAERPDASNSNNDRTTARRNNDEGEPGRGRSRSRLRRILLGRDKSESRTGDDRETMNTEDPLGLQGGCRDREGSGAQHSAGADSKAPQYARFRSAVVEALPDSDSPRGVNRNGSGQLSELSALQHPPTDVLPLQSGVLAVSAASRLLMRSVSLLGMEDPVVRRECGPVDVDLVVSAGDVDDECASAGEDRTATSEDGGGFDRRMFDQLLLIEANVKGWITAGNGATLDSNVVDAHRGNPPRSEAEDQEQTVSNTSVVMHSEVALAARHNGTTSCPQAGGAAGAATAGSAVRTASPSRSHMQRQLELDPSRSSRALQSILAHQQSSTRHAPPSSSPSNPPLTRAEVDTVLAALVHSHKHQLQSRRSRRRSLQEEVEPGFERSRVSADTIGEGRPGLPQARREEEEEETAAKGQESLDDPLLLASATDLLCVDRARTDRVLVKVRVKRRSTFCAGGEPRTTPNGGKVYRVPPAASAARRPSVRGHATNDNDNAPDPPDAPTAAVVQEIMSRPRLLPDMESVFA